LRSVQLRSGAVAAGQSIAELVDVDARLAAQRLSSQEADLLARIESIRQRALTDDAALLELSQTEEQLAALNKQIARLEEDLAKLTIRAPQAGVIVPPPARPAEERSRMRLASWSGRPLDLHNVGAFLEAGTLVCRIAQPEVGGEIDDARTGGEKLARLRHRDAVRSREEHDAAALKIRLRGLGEREIVVAAQAREHLRDAGAGIVARRDRDDLGVRVLREQPQQLDAGITGAADDADFDHAGHFSSRQNQRGRVARPRCLLE